MTYLSPGITMLEPTDRTLDTFGRHLFCRQGGEMAREFARKFYKSAAWQQARMQALIRDHGMCQTPGCFMPAQEVHHIIELTPENINDPRISLSLDNLQSLCRDCHQEKHKHHDEPRYIFDSNGNVIPR